MATTTTTYDASQVRDFSPVLKIMQDKYPTIFSRVTLESNPVTNKKVEWYDLTLEETSTTLSSGASATDTTISVSSATGFSTGDRILIKDGQPETFRISVSGTTLTLLDPDGTSAALAYDHSSGATVVNIATPAAEASTSSGDSVDNATLLYNYTQIFKRSIKQSGTQLSTQLEEAANGALPYYIEQKMIDLYREMNNAVLYGERYIGTATHPRLTGGLLWWMTDTTHGTPISTDYAGAALTIDAIDDLVERQYNNGGMSDTLICNPATNRKITSLARNLGGVQINVERTDSMTGNTIASIQGDFVGGGIREIVVDANMPDGALFLINSADLSFVPLAGRSIGMKQLASTGDYELYQMLGEYALKIQHPYNNHAYLYDFTV